MLRVLIISFIACAAGGAYWLTFKIVAKLYDDQTAFVAGLIASALVFSLFWGFGAALAAIVVIVIGMFISAAFNSR